MAIRIPYGDDEQFDLAAWFHSCYNRLRCYTSWSVYIFMYFGNVNSAGSFIFVAVIKLTTFTFPLLILIS